MDDLQFLIVQRAGLAPLGDGAAVGAAVDVAITAVAAAAAAAGRRRRRFLVLASVLQTLGVAFLRHENRTADALQ